MKKLIIILIAILVFISGCVQNNVNDNKNINQQKENEIPTLTQEEVINIAIEASGKYRDVISYGDTILNCIIENEEMVEIEGYHYYYLASCIDTVEEFNLYLNGVFTDKSIKAIMDTENIIIYEGKLLRLNADAGGGKDWRYPKIISLNQNSETAEVEIEVPSMHEEGNYTIQLTYKYIQNRGWLIDTETPFEDLY